MNPFMVHSGGFMVSRPRLKRAGRKTWFAARPLRSHRGGELEIKTGCHRTDESEELGSAP
jgi:hypothetical protein